MKIIKKFIALGLSLPLIGCAAAPVSWTGTYKATLNGVTGTATTYAKGDKVRMEFASQRRSSVMIARYDKDVIWLLAPTLSKFREISPNELYREFPLFTDPTIRIKRTEIGRESIDGREAMKYEAEIWYRGTTFQGFLWEAIPPLPVPLKWEDKNSKAVATWSDVQIRPVTAELFELPVGFTPVPPPKAPEKMGLANQQKLDPALE